MAVELSLSEARKYAMQCASRAHAAADARRFPDAIVESFSERSASLSHYSRSAATAMSEDPQFGSLAHFDGMMAWGAFVAFDLRRSTRRAMEIGFKDTFITMHTYLPTMIKVVRAGGGQIAGMRGDGAIALFGKIECESLDERLDTGMMSRAASGACACAQALTVAVSKAVNMALESVGVRADLSVGVGVDVGHFVATRIGFMGAAELTAYGDCVNRAAKSAEHGKSGNRVVVSSAVQAAYPKSPGGSTRFPKVPQQNDLHFLQLPEDYTPFRKQG